MADRLAGVKTTFSSKIHLQYSSAANLHVTTKFIGEWPEERVGEILTVLNHLQKPNPFSLEVTGLDLFPNATDPRVLYAVVETSPDLTQLAKQTDAALAGLGIPLENQPYSPHVTLARIQPRIDRLKLNEAVADYSTERYGRSEVFDFHLFQSRTGNGGSSYHKLATFVL